MIRVFVENGDRTNRKKARLKYLIDNWGVEKFLEETQKKLASELVYLPEANCVTRSTLKQHAHVGTYPQKTAGQYYVGMAIPVGRMSPEQFKEIGRIASRFGSGEIRLTVWQNLLIPNISGIVLADAKKAILETGFNYQASSILGGVISCTGSAGCKYAASNTKGQAVELAQYLNEKLELDQPINIHLTGCHHSCAQHYIGDIGMQATKVKVGEDTVEGYNIVLGGGVDNKQKIAREVFQNVPFYDIKELIEQLLLQYLETRNEAECFWEWSNRHSIEELKAFAEAVGA